MIRVILPVFAALASAVCLTASAAEPEPAVSLRLLTGSAERRAHDVHFRCEVILSNDVGRDLGVRSNFTSVFDGLEIVITTPEGKVVAQQGYSLHQSPYAPPGRIFPLKKGRTEGTLLFPVEGLPANVRMLKVRLVGTLPESGYERILSSETVEVEVKDPLGK